MTNFALFVLLAWAPISVGLFVLLPARRAVVVGAISGWLLTPSVSIDFPGFPAYSKSVAIFLGLLLGALIFDLDRLLRFRLRWFDLPMILFCVCPAVSSITNGFGGLEPVSAVIGQVNMWLLPYLIGRLYFTDYDGLRELAVGMIVGAACLIPACILENRMSPILLPMVYGISPFFLGARFGGYRPRVFFNTGLELGLWMNVATLAAFWLWQTKQLKSLWVFSSRTIFALLFITSGLCRSTGATVLLFGGMSMLWICQRTKTKWAMWFVLLLAPLYYGVRIPNIWSGDNLVEVVKTTLGEDRAGSLGYRLHFENLFIARAVQRPVFGWDGWGRNLVTDERGYKPGIDSLWVIIFGCNGYVGLFLMNAAMLLPVLLFLLRFPASQWTLPSLAPAAVLAVILNLFLFDCLLNAMPNAIYMIIAGGLAGMSPVRLPRAENAASFVSSSRERLAARYRAAGRAAKDQGRFAEAKTAWLHVLDLLAQRTSARPSNQVIEQQWCDCANDLAWLLVNAPDPGVRDIAQGVSLAVKATELRPESSTYWNTLGAAYYRAGEFKTAVAALNRAINVGNGGTVFDHVLLAAAHSRLGDQEQSRHWLALAMLEKERGPVVHSELTHLFNEAHSIAAAGPDAPAVAPPS
jgi:hypothetical protein